MIKTEGVGKYKNFLIKFLLIVIIMFSGWIFLRPKITDIFQMRKNLKEEKEKLTKLTQKEALLESLDEYELTTKTQFLLKILPSQKDVLLPLATLRSLADQLNLRVSSIQVNLSEINSSNQLSSIGFSLKIEGDRESIKEFIGKIRVTYHLMKIEDLNFSLKGVSESETTLKIKTFFLSLPKEIGKIEDPLSLITPVEEKVYQEVSIFSSPLREEFAPSVPVGKENPFVL